MSPSVISGASPRKPKQYLTLGAQCDHRAADLGKSDSPHSLCSICRSRGHRASAAGGIECAVASGTEAGSYSRSSDLPSIQNSDSAWLELGNTGRQASCHRPHGKLPMSSVSAWSRRSVPSRMQPRPAGLYDSPLEGDGFELLVPRHESPGFPKHPGHRGWL
jgi:hypothetical protein